jgi:predicted AAA+ superfamily ATPase
MKRKIEQYLLWWKNLDKEKMPLLLYGARQIGKTYLLQEFGAKYYQNFCYLNFETEPALSQIFADSIDPKVIISKIERYFNIQIKSRETLIVFDEIQNCNRALTSLKYFCENAQEYDLIGAGSLLGVHTTSTSFSFPVGKVITKLMHPMSFEEFLWESNKAVFIDKIEECFSYDLPMDNELHKSLIGLYNEYIIVGGMPLAVTCYFNQGSQLLYSEVQRIIIDTYISDMTKYTDKSQSIKTINTYESIISQLAKENRKFQYKLISKGARASLFGESIDWLIRAGVVLMSSKTSGGKMPPSITRDISAFKLYINDIGLACYKAGLTFENMRIFDSTFLGGITENYIANTLSYKGYELFYWTSESKAEVDFIIHKDSSIIPIEVKAGENTRSLSLNTYRKKYNPDYSIRISMKNFGFENGIKSVPLYAAFCI